MGVAIGQLQNLSRDRGRVDPFSTIVRALVAPPTRATNGVIAFSGDFVIGVRDAHALRQENARLRSVEESYKRYQEIYDLLYKDYSALRDQVGYELPKDKGKVFARVTSFMPFQSRMTIDRGSKHGISPHLAVVAAKGLVGIVETVSSDTSQVLLVTSPSIRVAVKVIGETNVPGISRGETPTRLVIDLLQSDVVHTGESVVTSGFSTTVPAGIPVGTIVDARMDDRFGTQRVFVVPSVSVGDVNEVFVVK